MSRGCRVLLTAGIVIAAIGMQFAPRGSDAFMICSAGMVAAAFLLAAS